MTWPAPLGPLKACTGQLPGREAYRLEREPGTVGGRPRRAESLVQLGCCPTPCWFPLSSAVAGRCAFLPLRIYFHFPECDWRADSCVTGLPGGFLQQLC